VRGKRAAAKLSFRHHDFAAIGSEDADGGFIEPREGDVGDASGEESDAGAARTHGGIGSAVSAIEKVVVMRGRKRSRSERPRSFSAPMARATACKPERW